MTLAEAEEIFMAASAGANYPHHLLPMAILRLSQADAVESEDEHHERVNGVSRNGDD